MKPGSRFGPYTVVGFLGSGGMATIFEGTHHLLGRRVAIKWMHETTSAAPEAAARFLREARVLARVRHPNVVELLDLGTYEDRHYLVMEHLEGESLESVLQRGTRMDADQATSVLLPIAAALSTLHSGGLLHRDVKPDNVLLALDEEGRVVPKLVDFGLAKELAELPTGSHHTIAGTPHYMSPEQARGSLDLDARVDQYAFGVMLYRVLTGAMPYDGPSLLELMRAIDAGVAVAPRVLVPSLAPGLEALVLRAMHRDPRARFGSMRELGRALLPYANARVRRECARDFEEPIAPPDPSGGRAREPGPSEAA